MYWNSDERAADENGSPTRLVKLLSMSNKFLASRSECFSLDISRELGLVCDLYTERTEGDKNVCLLSGPAIEPPLESYEVL